LGILCSNDWCKHYFKLAEILLCSTVIEIDLKLGFAWLWLGLAWLGFVWLCLALLGFAWMG
jgi:hypothetical protein